MSFLANALVVLVIVSHIGFLVLEMFFWNHPVGRRIFGMTAQQSADSAVLAANQGLYNGFLAAGLIWSLYSGQVQVKLFFLGCIVIAGIFGGMTAKRSIIVTQALPAAIAMGLVLVSA